LLDGGSLVELISERMAKEICATTYTDTGKEISLADNHTTFLKVQCFYLRQDDKNGEKKRGSDVNDIKFLVKGMVKRSEFVSDACAHMFKFGHYHLLELRQALGAERTSDFIRVGGRKFMLPWDQNSEAQKEYFSCFAEPGADPFTVELEEE
jgi:hypothetical protein